MAKTHIMVIPFPQSGHMLPLVDLIHHLLRRDCVVSVVITPKNLHFLDHPLRFGSPENLRPLAFPFPPHPSIPFGVENMSNLPVHAIDDMVRAFALLHDPLFSWLESSSFTDRPTAIIADMFAVPWTNKLAAAFGIKSIAFLPTTAHTLSMVRQLNDRGFVEDLMQSVSQSWGVVLNTFKELEVSYVEDLKKNFMGHHRVWTVGPILLATEFINDRGGKSSVPVDELTAWLDTFPENSVVYVGFGSQVNMSKAQGEAIAAALEQSGVRFIWAVKTSGGEDRTAETVPRGFEDRTEDRGRVIRGWAPQKVILEHKTVGSYLTHFGWGSILEGIVGGTVLLAWPMHADNHFNTKLLADELGAAVKVCNGMDSVPDSKELAKVLTESVREDMPQRQRLMELRRMALAAVEEGGSSDKALDDLVREVSTVHV